MRAACSADPRVNLVSSAARLTRPGLTFMGAHIRLPLANGGSRAVPELTYPDVVPVVALAGSSCLREESPGRLKGTSAGGYSFARNHWICYLATAGGSSFRISICLLKSSLLSSFCYASICFLNSSLLTLAAWEMAPKFRLGTFLRAADNLYAALCSGECGALSSITPVCFSPSNSLDLNL